MAESGARLRSVESGESAPEGRPPAPGSNRLPAVLAAALALTLALLVWSRLELGQRIGALEEQARELRETVEARDATIAAQGDKLAARERRLADATAGVQEVLELLEAPLD